MADGIPVILCNDHFRLLRENKTCDLCPSKCEHEAAIMAVSQLREHDRDQAVKTLLAEIQAVKSVQLEQSAQLLKVLEQAGQLTRLQTIVTGVDGDNGLRTDMHRLASEMRGLSRWVWIGIGIAMAVATLIPLFFEFLKK